MSGQFAATGAQKFADFDVNSIGDNELVAAVAGKKLRVLSIHGVSAGINNVKLKSGAGTDLTGVMPHVANQRLAYEFSEAGHVETAAGAALNLNLSAAVAMGGSMVYQEIN